MDFVDDLFNIQCNHKGPHRSVFICRVQDLRELGELSPHWDNLRKEVMTRYGGIISSYQETLTELDKITGMAAPRASFYVCLLCPHIHKGCLTQNYTDTLCYEILQRCLFVCLCPLFYFFVQK